MLSVQRTRTWVRCAFRAMGAPCEFLIDGANEHIVTATREVARLESIWSRFRPDSELVALNESHGTWFTPGPDLWDALLASAVMYHATDGLFDPTILDALENVGYDRTFGEISAEGPAVTAPRPAVGFDHVQFDSARSAVRLPDGVRIDLGGIGKGLAADRVSRLLIATGARSVCVSLGGDIHVAGRPSEPGGWPIPLEHPGTREGEFATVRIASGGLVTSTILERHWQRNGERFHHIIDPATGDSSRTDVQAAVVAHASTATAEVLAKAAIVGGRDRGSDVITSNGAWGWLLTADGHMEPVGGPRAVSPEVTTA